MTNKYYKWIVIAGLVVLAVSLLVFMMLRKANNKTLPNSVNSSVSVITPDKATEFADENAGVVGELKYVFNNGKTVLFSFNDPHAGHFKFQINKSDWDGFGSGFGTDIGRDKVGLYLEGDKVEVTGKIVWYQGDPVIYVTNPDQIVKK